MDLLFLFTGLGLGFFTGWLFFRNKGAAPVNTLEIDGLKGQVVELDKQKSLLTEKISFISGQRDLDIQKLETSIIELQKTLEAERDKVRERDNRIAKAEEIFKNYNEKLNTQKSEYEDLQKRFTTEFENIAGKLLEEKSKKFTEQNREQLDSILSPLKEKIQLFEKKVEESYDKELRDKISLREEVKKLYELNSKISEEANNLTRALKGDNKMQGNWGEVILEKILERSGLKKDVEYKTQVSMINADGIVIRPDVIIYLPDKKNIVIDSKVSLVAYEAYANSEIEEERERFLKEHLLSLRSHIKGLSEKSYFSGSELNTPDFVLMFIPIESCFSVAIQSDLEMFNFAWERKIVLVSPSTLLATLRTINSIWMQEKQTRHAIDIARESGRLYDKFVGFVEDMQKLGDRIDSVSKSYDESMKKLTTGNGNLVTRVEKLKVMGAKASKQLPAKFLNEKPAEMEEEPEEKLIEDHEV
jgi:DNA recombination protein RmuC